MAIQGFCPPSSPPSHSPPSHSPYYQLLERGSARLGRVKNTLPDIAIKDNSLTQTLTFQDQN